MKKSTAMRLCCTTLSLALLLLVGAGCSSQEDTATSQASSSGLTAEEFESLVENAEASATESEEESVDPFESMTDEEIDAYFEAADEGYTTSDDLNLTALDAEGISQVEMVTWDGYLVSLPIVDTYDSDPDVMLNNDQITDFDLTSSGYTLTAENLDASTRTVKEVLQTCIEGYYEALVEQYDYKETVALTGVTFSEDGSACTAGFAYYDEELDAEIVVLNLMFEVEGSDWCLAYEMLCQPTALTAEDVAAFEAMYDYVGLELPVSLS
ncbi:MAG: hypothetical protein LUC48_02240 [Clostridiales bacterium]|nr:hypothetical protein [Clostridiales bacterium]